MDMNGLRRSGFQRWRWRWRGEEAETDVARKMGVGETVTQAVLSHVAQLVRLCACCVACAVACGSQRACCMGLASVEVPVRGRRVLATRGGGSRDAVAVAVAGNMWRLGRVLANEMLRMRPASPQRLVHAFTQEDAPPAAPFLHSPALRTSRVGGQITRCCNATLPCKPLNATWQPMQQVLALAPLPP